MEPYFIALHGVSFFCCRNVTAFSASHPSDERSSKSRFREDPFIGLGKGTSLPELPEPVRNFRS